MKRDSKKNTGKKNRKVLGVSFRSLHLAEAALLHPSHRNEYPPERIYQDFDRMEFFGDSILGLIICEELYKRFPEADEGLLSRLRSILVSKKILSRIAREIKLPAKLQLGTSLRKQKDFLKVKIFADALEAFIAAVYLDRGLAEARKLISRLFKGYFDAKKLFRLDPNPKSTLQELVQKNWQKLPDYQSVQNAEGSTTTLTITRNRKVTAKARTRRESEEKAARLMIRMIRQELAGRFKRKSSGKKLLKTL